MGTIDKNRLEIQELLRLITYNHPDSFTEPLSVQQYTNLLIHINTLLQSAGALSPRNYKRVLDEVLTVYNDGADLHTVPARNNPNIPMLKVTVPDHIYSSTAHNPKKHSNSPS